MSEKSSRDIELIELSGIMRTDSGRKVLLRILRHSGFFDSGWNEDSRKHAFHEGRRSEGLWLFQELQEADPAQLMNMLKEHVND